MLEETLLIIMKLNQDSISFEFVQLLASPLILDVGETNFLTTVEAKLNNFYLRGMENFLNPLSEIKHFRKYGL